MTDGSRRREPKSARPVCRSLSRSEEYRDTAAHYVEKARRTSDARYRSFLIDQATTWWDLAEEFLDGAQCRMERLTETPEMAADVDGFDPQDEPRTITRLEPRVLH
jgi:hypothetical protein